MKWIPNVFPLVWDRRHAGGTECDVTDYKNSEDFLVIHHFFSGIISVSIETKMLINSDGHPAIKESPDENS